MDDFYPHPPRGGRHLAELQNIMMRAISIHALREEGDEAHCGSAKLLQAISIHALREEGDVEVRQAHGDEHISIHALREEGDDPSAGRWRRVHNFYPRPPRGGRRLSCRHLLDAVQISIHALREEGDIPVIKQYFGANAFLSTPSARRATGVSCPSMVRKANFYPRPPRGGRLLGLAAGVAGEGISIHALREEGDMYAAMSTMAVLYFYPRPPRGGRLIHKSINIKIIQFLSTPSARRATYPQKYQHQNNPISIHALREEGDHSRHSKTSSTSYFYPRPPRGGRRDSETNGSKTIKFLSTPSARRATYPQKYQHQNNPISIHALREEGDLMMLCSSVSAILFLSTPSARRATDKRAVF